MMPTAIPSTAVGAAFIRAAHLTEDGHPKIFQDVLAPVLVGRELAMWLEDVLRQSWPSEVLPVFRVAMVTRARYTEDRLRQRSNAGVDQYIILGAGLDTFGYRGPEALSALRVFEVDHPTTQAWKRERLRTVGINEPIGVQFVSVDFERESLREELVTSSFSRIRTTQ